MRSLLASALLVAMASAAWAQQPAQSPRSAEDTARAVHADVAHQKIQWRYKWHNGQWWYWMPDNSWMIWNGATWVPYSALRYDTGYRGYGRGDGPPAFYYGRNTYGPGYWGYAPGFYGQGYGRVPGNYASPGAARGMIGGAIGVPRGLGVGAGIGGAISR